MAPWRQRLLPRVRVDRSGQGRAGYFQCLNLLARGGISVAEVREHPRIIVQHSRLLVLLDRCAKSSIRSIPRTSARCSAVMSTIVTLTTCARRCAECSMRFGKCFPAFADDTRSRVRILEGRPPCVVPLIFGRRRRVSLHSENLPRRDPFGEIDVETLFYLVGAES